MIDAKITEYALHDVEFDEVAPEDAKDYDKCLIRFKNSWRREMGSIKFNDDPRFQEFVKDYCTVAYDKDLPVEEKKKAMAEKLKPIKIQLG